MSAPTPCVIYAAKSTQDKHKSIPTQLKDCREKAAEEGWEVVDDFHDEGFSAYSGNRGPDLEKAKWLAAEVAAQRGTNCMLIAQHTDRFARGAGDEPGAADSLVEIWHAMRRANVHLRSVQNDAATSDPVYIALAAKQAYEESQRKSEAVKSGKRRKVAERGGTNGPLCFGYRFDDPDSVKRRRVPDPDEVSAFLHVAEMLHEGKNFAAMCRWLTANGHLTKRGNPFAPQRVRDFLGNPYYAGKVKVPGGELVDGIHDAIISWEEHERICAELDAIGEASNARGGRRPARPILLSGVMRCAHCGRGIWHRPYESGRRDYLCGNVRQLSGICDAAPIDAATLERAVVDHLGGLFVDLGEWIERMTEQRADERQILEREAARLMKQAQGLEGDEGLVRADYMKQLRAGNEAAAGIAATEIARIEGERAELDGKLADVEARIAEWDGGDSTDQVLDWWTEFSRAVRGEIVNSESIADANAAFKERFAAIFVHSPADGSPRLDFVLKERPPGMPLVSSRLWVDDPDALPEDGTLIDFLGEEPEEGDAVKLVGSLWSG
jgi:DNA invertase Pin-like site-specific DNA recombinase